jgi:hypothetical protein
MEGFTAGRNRNVDEESGHMGSRRGQNFSSSDFRGVGVDEQISTFLFLPAFVSVLSGKPAPQKPVFSFSSF